MEIFRNCKEKYGCSLILLLVMIVSAFLWTPVFYLNDDVTMRTILSGAYSGTPDGHAVYMQYPMTGILALLYFVLPMIPWLELFFAGCIWLCMVLVAVSFRKKWVGVLFSIVLYLPFFLYMHYTIVAALVAATAVFLLCRGEKTFCALVLLWIAYMIRSQVGLLCLPFVMAALVWRLLQRKSEWKKELVQVGKCVGGLLVGLGLITGINYLFYMEEAWQEYLAYNDYRTQLYDYTDFLSTDKYSKEHSLYGMTREEYNLLFHYNTMLDGGIDLEKMREIAEKVSGGMKREQSTVEILRDSLQKYYTQIRYSDYPYNYIWIAGILILVIGFLINKKWLQILYLGILEMGRSAIWMYLLWQGRFPERVSISLYLLELVLLLGIGMTALQFKRELPEWLTTGATLILIFAMGVYFGSETVDKVKERNNIQAEWNSLKGYCAENPQNTYLLDVFSSVKYADQLFVKDCENLMLLGGWLSASPLAQERMEALGGMDASEALFTNDDVYLVVLEGRDVVWMKEYFEKRYVSVKLEEVDDCTWSDGGFDVYALH